MTIITSKADLEFNSQAQNATPDGYLQLDLANKRYDLAENANGDGFNGNAGELLSGGNADDGFDVKAFVSSWRDRRNNNTGTLYLDLPKTLVQRDGIIRLINGYSITSRLLDLMRYRGMWIVGPTSTDKYTYMETAADADFLSGGGQMKYTRRSGATLAGLGSASTAASLNPLGPVDKRPRDMLQAHSTDAYNRFEFYFSRPGQELWYGFIDNPNYEASNVYSPTVVASTWSKVNNPVGINFNDDPELPASIQTLTLVGSFLNSTTNAAVTQAKFRGSLKWTGTAQGLFNNIMSLSQRSVNINTTQGGAAVIGEQSKWLYLRQPKESNGVFTFYDLNIDITGMLAAEQTKIRLTDTDENEYKSSAFTGMINIEETTADRFTAEDNFRVWVFNSDFSALFQDTQLRILSDRAATRLDTQPQADGTNLFALEFDGTATVTFNGTAAVVGDKIFADDGTTELTITRVIGPSAGKYLLEIGATTADQLDGLIGSPVQQPSNIDGKYDATNVSNNSISFSGDSPTTNTTINVVVQSDKSRRTVFPMAVAAGALTSSVTVSRGLFPKHGYQVGKIAGGNVFDGAIQTDGTPTLQPDLGATATTRTTTGNMNEVFWASKELSLANMGHNFEVEATFIQAISDYDWQRTNVKLINPARANNRYKVSAKFVDNNPEDTWVDHDTHGHASSAIILVNQQFGLSSDSIGDAVWEKTLVDADYAGTQAAQLLFDGTDMSNLATKSSVQDAIDYLDPSNPGVRTVFTTGTKPDVT